MHVNMFCCSSKKVSVFMVTLLISVCVLQFVTSANDLFIQEGEDADIKFSFHIVAPVDFQLKVGHKDPFFKNGHTMADRLTPSQQKRLRVSSWYSELEEHMLVHMKLTSVARTDAGAYTCNLVRNGKVLIHSTQTISLSVDFPPGAVTCSVLLQTEYNDWDKLQCAAIGGSPPGKISCFQNNYESPLCGRDLANGTHILQKFLIMKNVPAFCCSHANIAIHWENCKDYVHQDSNTKYGSGPFGTPRSFLTSQQPTETLLKQTPSCGSDDSNTDEESGRASSVNSITLLVVIVVLVCILVLALPFILCYMKRHLHSDGNDGHSYTPVKTHPSVKTEQPVNSSDCSDNQKGELNETKSSQMKETSREVVPKPSHMSSIVEKNPKEEVKENSLEVVANDVNIEDPNLLEKENANGDHEDSRRRDPPETTEHDPCL